MAKWLFIVETNCSDPAREGEFNQWYDKIHLPDVLETPGFLRAARYKNPSPGEGRGKFLATYEIETEDIAKTMAALMENMAQKREQGRISELMVRVSRDVYREISSLAR